MNDNKLLLSKIVEGMQEKKAKNIVTVDMTKLDAPCQYFVICEGDSNVHISAISASVKDYVREQLREKPFAVDGLENCLWVAMDYGTIIVHIFNRETRSFYDIEHLWADAFINRIPDLD